MGNYIDPFGAPEFLVAGIAHREMVGTEIIKAVYFAMEDGQPVAKVKLLWQVPQLLQTQEMTCRFVRAGLIVPSRMMM